MSPSNSGGAVSASRSRERSTAPTSAVWSNAAAISAQSMSKCRSAAGSLTSAAKRWVAESMPQRIAMVGYLPRDMYPGAFAATHPDKPAVIMAGSGFVQSFAELDAAANRLSRLLRSVGVQPGDHVAICMENHDRYLEVALGVPLRRRVYTACSSRLTSERAELHRRRLRSGGVHHLRVQGRAGCRDRGRDAGGQLPG